MVVCFVEENPVLSDLSSSLSPEDSLIYVIQSFHEHATSFSSCKSPLFELRVVLLGSDLIGACLHQLVVWNSNPGPFSKVFTHIATTAVSGATPTSCHCKPGRRRALTVLLPTPAGIAVSLAPLCAFVTKCLPQCYCSSKCATHLNPATQSAEPNAKSLTMLWHYETWTRALGDQSAARIFV
jgi:hypothetical protein